MSGPPDFCTRCGQLHTERQPCPPTPADRIRALEAENERLKSGRDAYRDECERLAAAAEARATRAEGWARDWHSVVETMMTIAGLSSALGGEESVAAMRNHLTDLQDRATKAEAANAGLVEALNASARVLRNTAIVLRKNYFDATTRRVTLEALDDTRDRAAQALAANELKEPTNA